MIYTFSYVLIMEMRKQLDNNASDEVYRKNRVQKKLCDGRPFYNKGKLC